LGERTKNLGSTSDTQPEMRRSDNLTVARQKIRRIINANKNQYDQKTKFITYTFKENITSLEEANKKWRKYCKKIQYRYGKIKYLSVVEFQKRGAIHYHVLYFNLPYIKEIKPTLSKLWKHGFINIKTLKEVRNVGAYVCKYLQKEIMDKRLLREKAYFCSKGLIKFEEYKHSEDIAEKLASGIIEKEVQKEYESMAYGRIIYQQGIIRTIQ